MKTPRLKGATLVASEEVDPKVKVEVWQGDKGFYIYFRGWGEEPDDLVLSRGPLKKKEHALEYAKRLRDTLYRIQQMAFEQ